MNTSPLGPQIFRRLFALALVALSGWALADPPSRVARLSYVSGGASFSPGGERDWGRAVINRPLVIGDRLWVERGARAELQMGTAALRLSGWRYKLAFYRAPYELKLLQRMIHYRRPETMGF